MLNMLTRTALGLFLVAGPVAAQIAQPAPRPTDDAELALLFHEDQRVRVAKPLGPEEPKITRKDADREVLVKQMLSANQVVTTADELHAAVILQHSHEASDLLRAHVLAVLCAAEGDKTCVWLSAATLDRYLQTVSQPQIFGTQYNHFDRPPVTQEPYANDVLPDSLRKKFGLSSLEEQKKRLEEINSRSGSGQGVSSPASQNVPAKPKDSTNN